MAEGGGAGIVIEDDMLTVAGGSGEVEGLCSQAGLGKAVVQCPDGLRRSAKRKVTTAADWMPRAWWKGGIMNAERSKGVTKQQQTQGGQWFG